MSEWISVKERLPERFETVLIYVGSGTCRYVTIGSWYALDEGVRWYSREGDEPDSGPVSHWMPLPDHPKEGE